MNVLVLSPLFNVLQATLRGRVVRDIHEDIRASQADYRGYYRTCTYPNITCDLSLGRDAVKILG